MRTSCEVGVRQVVRVAELQQFAEATGHYHKESSAVLRGEA